MARKYIIILVLLVTVPLLALFGLSWRLIEAEQARTAKQFEDLLQANLAEIDRDITDYFDEVELNLLDLSIDPTVPLEIREAQRGEPLIDQIIVLDTEGQVVYPREPLSNQEFRFLLNIGPLITDRVFVPQPRVSSNARSVLPAQSLTRNQTRAQSQRQTQTQSNDIPTGDGAFGFDAPDFIEPQRITINGNQNRGNFLSNGSNQAPNAIYTNQSDITPEYGWYNWYWVKGLQLIHWRRLPGGLTQVIFLRRSRWMADIISELPDSAEAETKSAALRVQLLDSDGDVVYLWGAAPKADEDASPVVSRHVSSPLGSWQLQHYGPVEPIQFGNIATKVNLLTAGGLLSLGLLGMAIYLGREIGRQTREARERVNFVNQVSHELKTPLTNIRMYADLVQNDLDRIDPEDERSQNHVSVITSESARLSRLINNVLTFAGRNHRKERPQMQVGRVDDVIQTVLDQFRPSLEGLGFEVVLDLDAAQQVQLDRDVAEQMLGNLVSNAEKYAADGKHLRIRSRFQNDVTTIDVTDAGPGVPHHFARHIFQAFERASDHINSATGTGIGLTITRSLAQQHGGNLELLDSTIGATFRLTLRTPLSQTKSVS